MPWLKGDEIDGTVFVARPARFYFPKATAKTASYTVKRTDCGKFFTTRGASGAVTFTLPSKKDGLFFYFGNAVDQDMVVAADAANTIITYNNNSTADSVSFATASQKIGGLLLVYCDGTSWWCINLSPNTLTVTTS